MNEDQTSTEPTADAPAVETQQHEAHQPDPQSPDPRRRLRELLAIPERDRSDEVWDEIIGLEIDMAPGNRANSPQVDPGRRQESGRRPDQQGRRQDQQARRPEQQQQPRRQDAAARPKPGKRFFQKRKRGPGTPPER